MTRITKDQARALKRTYDRSPMEISYLAFRRGVLPTWGCDNAVIVKWCGMWLCIERDGYTHS
jgi:hypothetical protein